MIGIKQKKVMLVILDGFGIRKESRGNAIKQADPKNFNYYFSNFPHTTLYAHGKYVGVPDGQIGNSEVGHTTIGAGRLIEQDLIKINKSIKNGSFFRNKVLNDAIEYSKKHNSDIHLIGLLSDGGVHSHINHLFALLDLMKKKNFKRVYIHPILDGRDTPKKSAKKYIKKLQSKTKRLGFGEIATMIGRFYALDRDNRWNREHKAYDLLVNGNGIEEPNPIKAIDDSYKLGVTDEFVEPTLINKNGLISEKDTVIFFNFRSDRARELTKAFVQGRFNKFQRRKIIGLNFITLTQYDSKIKTKVAFPFQRIKNGLSEVISRRRFRQFKIAETEKYAHVTYFFNGGSEHPFNKEDRRIVKSPQVKTYDEKPEMSVYEIADVLSTRIKSRKYKLIVVNVANPDMVGHTGEMGAIKKAIKATDICLRNIVEEARMNDYYVIITADHGNAEQVIGNHKTTHTTNKVPFVLVVPFGVHNDLKLKKVKKASLQNIAPTILSIMNLSAPKEMRESLIEFEDKKSEK